MVIFVVLDSLLGSSRSKTVAPAVGRVVIPEGSTRLQIAQIAAGDGLTGSYRAAAKSSPLLNPAHYGAPRYTPDLEGFLFPATYDLAPRSSVGRLVDGTTLPFGIVSRLDLTVCFVGVLLQFFATPSHVCRIGLGKGTGDHHDFVDGHVHWMKGERLASDADIWGHNGL